MAKNRNRPSQKGKRQPKVQNPTQPDRRAFLRIAKNAAIGLPIVGIGAYFAVRKVQADVYETDLTRIGNGTPTIVQIHDPQCPDCAVLQGQTRGILAEFEDGDYTYLVANLANDSGYAFANQFGVSRVTLLLFDGAGEAVEVIRGPIPTPQLETVLRRHITG